MEIELSEDLQHYKESFILGLTVKQAFFSILALGTGTAIVLLLHTRIGVTLSCYVATPFVVPLALTGFYHYHGLTFWQFAGKMVHFAFFNRPLLYWSTESMEELEQIVSEERQEEQKGLGRKAGTEEKTTKESRKIKEYKKKSTNREADQSRKNRNGETKRNEEMNQSRKMNSKMEIGKEPKQIEKNSRADELGKNRMRNKRKRRRSKNMVTVVKKRKSAGLIAVMVIGWILTLTALLAAGAAMAAVWYGQFR